MEKRKDKTLVEQSLQTVEDDFPSVYINPLTDFGLKKLFRKQAPRKKNWDFNLKAVYVVSILNFITFKEKTAKKNVIQRVYLYREKGKTLFSEKLKFIFIELPKFKKKLSDLQNNTDIWLYLLKNTFYLKSCPPENGRTNGKRPPNSYKITA